MTKNNDTALLPYRYAPGDYQSKCIHCEKLFTGDKRARCCKSCAEVMLERDNTRSTAPQNAALGVDRQSVDQETVTNEMIAAALEESLAVMKEYNVDALSPFADYPPPSVVVKRAITAALKVRPTAPQNAALEALDKVKLGSIDRKFSESDWFLYHHSATIRAALQSPKPVKQNAEALEAFETLEMIYQNHIEETLEEELPDDDETVFAAQECRRIIRAALNQPRTVKPLVWEKQLEQLVAKVPFDREYAIIKVGGKFTLYFPEAGVYRVNFGSEDDAKAAAEAHWQQKIGECLG